MNLKNFTDADKLAAKNGWKKATGRIYVSDYKNQFACVIKLDGVIQAFIGYLKYAKRMPKK